MEPSWVGRMRVIEVMKFEAGVAPQAVDAVWQTMPFISSAHLFSDIHFTKSGVCIQYEDFVAMFLEFEVFVWVLGSAKEASIEYSTTSFEEIGRRIQTKFDAYICNLYAHASQPPEMPRMGICCQ